MTETVSGILKQGKRGAGVLYDPARRREVASVLRPPAGRTARAAARVGGTPRTVWVIASLRTPLVEPGGVKRREVGKGVGPGRHRKSLGDTRAAGRGDWRLAPHH